MATGKQLRGYGRGGGGGERGLQPICCLCASHPLGSSLHLTSIPPPSPHRSPPARSATRTTRSKRRDRAAVSGAERGGPAGSRSGSSCCFCCRCCCPDLSALGSPSAPPAAPSLGRALTGSSGHRVRSSKREPKRMHPSKEARPGLPFFAPLTALPTSAPQRRA